MAEVGTNVDPNMKLSLVGHQTNPYLVGHPPTYTSTTTKGGDEDVYSSTLMVPVKMKSREAVTNTIWNRSDQHPERKYYVYRFTYEIAKLLGVRYAIFSQKIISRITLLGR